MRMSTWSNKIPRPGDVWLVHFPYITPGNMEKIRPAIILKIKEDKVTVQKLTTSKKKGNKLFTGIKTKRVTYISNDILSISEYNLVRKLGHIELNGGDAI